jgi:hypothetical protein
MAFSSWFSSCGTVRDDEPPSMVQTNYGNPELDRMRQAAAEDVALIESDNRPVDEASPDEP